MQRCWLRSRLWLLLEALAEEYDMPDLPAHFKQARHQLEALRKRGKQEAPEDA